MKSQPNLMSLLLGSLALLINRRIYKKQMSPPTLLGKYQLVRIIKKQDKYANFSLAIYRIGKKRFFVKTWHGRFKDLNYYFLINEYLVGKFFNSYTQKIRFPKVIELLTYGSYTSVIFEYVQGKSLQKFPIGIQARTISQVISWLTEVSPSFSQVWSPIPVRPLGFYLLILPLLAVALLILSPSQYRTIIHSVWMCFKSALTTDRNLVLAHRDLTPENIIVQHSRIFLLDNETLAFTLPAYDLSYLNTLTEYSPLAELLKREYKLHTSPFLEIYITLHQAIGSGDFLKIQSSLISKLHELNLNS